MKPIDNRAIDKSVQDNIAKQFEYINTIIEQRRYSALSHINTVVLMTSWDVGQYISLQLRTSCWGTRVVDELANYLKLQNPKRRGFGRRNLYNMVKFYETYSEKAFDSMVESLHVNEIVQLPTALIENENFVQLPISQSKQSVMKSIMPEILSITTFTNHVEIMNRCRSYEERLFYMLYAHHHNMKTSELRRCIVNQTYNILLDKEKMLSPKMLLEYPNTEFMLKDKTFIDFLNLPEEHSEHHLHKGLIEHMKDFILEIGKDFLFIESEYCVQVGGSSKRIDLLFYHRALQCLVAIELKTVDFRPEFVGKMDMYLEALDRDIKRDNENPSIGIILCPSADRSMVEYTLSRSLSPTMIAEYQRKLIPLEVMRKSLEEYCAFLKENKK